MPTLSLRRPTYVLLVAAFVWIISLFSVQAQDADSSLFPFYHGVASGDPLTDRVIIWTRVTPDEDSTIEVAWRVATDPGLSDVVRSGLFMTGAHRDYTVKVDVDGLLPGTTYYYGFTALNKTSMVGKTKTTPDTMVDQIKFAVVSCNNYQHGYFNAFGRIADRTDLDAVVHLGDYIYEISASGSDFYGAPSLRDRGERLHTPDKEILSLEDYRIRYAQYRLDPDLMRAHQQHPFILIWDDHESANDSYQDGAENHQPGEGEWEDRKAIAKQVYDEWMPIRSDLNQFPLYRTVHYGDLVDLVMLDTRLEGREEQIGAVVDPALYAADRTILGATQKEWFFDQLADSDARWKVIGNQVIFSEFNVWWAANPADPVLNSGVALESIFLDIWDGYPSERDQIIQFIAGTDTGNPIDNVVILTGDFHSSFGYDVSLKPAPLSGSDPSIAVANTAPIPVQPTYDPTTGAGSVAVEFATPSVTSANFDENLDPITAGFFQLQINNPLPESAGPVAGVNPNPHMKYVDLNRHGYFVLDITPDRAQADWFYTDDIFTRNTDEQFDDAWFTADGENRLQKADGPSSPKVEQDSPAPLLPKPSVPQASLTRDTEGNVVLTWTDSDAETAYIIERSVGSGAFEEVSTVGADETTLIDSELGDDSARYRVKAINDDFESEYSNIVSLSTSSVAFVLVNAETESDIQRIEQGQVIDLRTLSSNSLSIRAEFNESNPSSVQFELNGEVVRTEGVEPFALGGDRAGDYQPYAPLSDNGVFHLVVKGVSASGELLESASVLFQLLTSDEYVTDFVLVDADTDLDIEVLSKGRAEIDLSTISATALSIRANINGSVESVSFSDNGGEVMRIEDEAPYALGGDVAGNYTPVAKLTEAGTFDLYAIPFSGNRASGNQGTPLSLEITVKGAPASARKGDESQTYQLLQEIPETVVLATNYPNPFNPTTTIQFGLPAQMQARVVLYDLLGRIVGVIADDVYSQGWHNVQFDGSNLASGIYIYQLETENTVLIGQMILQK